MSGILTVATAVEDHWTSNCKLIGRFSTQNHHFSGEIPQYLCIFNRKMGEKLAFILQFAVLSVVSLPAHIDSCVLTLARHLLSKGTIDMPQKQPQNCAQIQRFLCVESSYMYRYRGCAGRLTYGPRHVSAKPTLVRMSLHAGACAARPL